MCMCIPNNPRKYGGLTDLNVTAKDNKLNGNKNVVESQRKLWKYSQNLKNRTET